MNKERAFELADALESGKYKQGEGQLKNRQDNFCCLGVACDISKLGVWSESYGNQHYVVSDEDEHNTHLPRAVSAYFGMVSNDGRFAGSSITDGEKEHGSLIDMNDTGVPFATIAKVIREHWEKL